ncbi:hypothetical protein WMY93_032035 [Mugilogobius chulae]|uniref:Uncharacterized protein n=1 Tax=Mugilogobius chulae TaxID=88201 RepID=A0AAW0MDN0_9GOBI
MTARVSPDKNINLRVSLVSPLSLVLWFRVGIGAGLPGWPGVTSGPRVLDMQVLLTRADAEQKVSLQLGLDRQQLEQGILCTRLLSLDLCGKSTALHLNTVMTKNCKQLLQTQNPQEGTREHVK